MTLTISGPAGDLEALYSDTGNGSRCALLCHPHPQFGGSMHDGVLAVVAEAIAAQPSEQRHSHLRFNFRGVGGSAGSFDNGVGEQEDLIAAWDWLTQQKDWDDQVLIGYSFGAAMAWAAQARCRGLSRLVLIAPPNAAMPFDAPDGAQGDAPTVYSISGSSDSYVAPQALPASVQQQVLDGADHFFSGHAHALQAAIAAVLDG